MAQALARGVLRLERPVYAAGYAAVAGKKEGQGPMGKCFDRVEEDSHFGQETWEQAESRMQQETIYLAM